MTRMPINGKVFDYYNVDDNKLNYTQKNNLYSWGGGNKNAKVNRTTTCNCTSMCMGLDYAGFKFPVGEYEQPEDNLAKFIMESKLVDDEYKKRYPAMYSAYKEDLPKCYTPNEIHKLLQIGTNEWMGTDAVTFHDSISIDDIDKEIVERGSPVIVSGAFPQSDGTVLNHIVCLVGIAVLKKEKYYVIDDPWGYTIDYGSGRSGNDVVIPEDKFMAWMKPVGSRIKFAHTFGKPAAII